MVLHLTSASLFETTCTSRLVRRGDIDEDAYIIRSMGEVHSNDGQTSYPEISTSLVDVITV